MQYSGEKAAAVSFPLGGIGTGCIGLLGNGELSDFEIFGRPSKNMRHGYTHFAVRAKTEGGVTARVLHGDTNESYMGRPRRGALYAGFGFGPASDSLAGFPHFRNVSFDGTFPTAHLTFRDPDFPAVVRMLAFSPFIPHREDDSGIPAAFFELTVENPTGGEVEYTVALTVAAPAGGSTHTVFGDNGATGICLTTTCDPASPEYAELAILTDGEDAAAQEYWYRGSWMDGVTTYWREMMQGGRMSARHYDTPRGGDHATLTATLTLAPRQTGRVRFLLSWHVPNYVNHWGSAALREAGVFHPYYTTRYESARESAVDGLCRFTELLADTCRFRDALHGSTLPPFVLDAVSSTLAVLRSPTVLRLDNGALWGFEGVGETVGSCYGSCQHVYNYAFALPYLFPRLERSLREMNARYGLHADGGTAFRIQLPLTEESTTPHACLDGQMGEIVKIYREWRLSGDRAFLARMAPVAYRMLEYAWSQENPDGWDRDRDGVLEGRQHHTLDMELFGPSSWLEGMYLLALDCAAEMAEALGEPDRAADYRDLYRRGRAYMNDRLFFGGWFAQEVDLRDVALVDRYGARDTYYNTEAGEIKYQIGAGCEIDQMLAEWFAHLVGRPMLYDREKKAAALSALFANNHKPTMRGVTNMWRNFALNDEAGTVICTYPAGVRTPAIPIAYCEECMTGFEYALGGLMLAEGRIGEGECIVKAVRDRYDGKKRNPWNEIECGSNYVRSMASFALLPIYAGMTADMTVGHLGFSPIKKGDGCYLFSVGEAYGTVTYEAGRCTLRLLAGSLVLSSFSAGVGRPASLTADGAAVPFTEEGGCLRFCPVTVKETLVLEHLM